MALDYGTGVSRTLDPAKRQFLGLVWQKGRPPLDSELALVSQVGAETERRALQAMMPSGFFLDPTRALEDYQTDSLWTNLFKFGNPRPVQGTVEVAEAHPVLWACVNGWILPLVGSSVSAEGDFSNWVKLYPPPESDSRIDLVFLEVWQTRVDPNPSTVNKPSASTLWKYGNVLYGGTNLTDDLEDPAIGAETTGRIQIQHRIRVYGSGVGLGSSVALDVYPDGLGDPYVYGQGTATLPVAGFTFINMREELNDPSLWRAGDGNPNNGLGTVDGYVYAVPICALFRRNSNVYTAVTTSGNPNQNGAFNRTPGSKWLPNPLTGARVLAQATLTAVLGPTTGVSADAVVQVTNLNGCGLEDSALVLSSTFLTLDDEIIGIRSVDLVAGTITIRAGGRGRYGTAAVGHPAGTPIQFFTSRVDGYYSDQIAPTDILDMRRGINPGDWDYGRLLEHNIGALLKGKLWSSWKEAALGDTQGPVVHEVDYLYSNGAVAVPNQTEALDGPDGIRTVFSDAATMQPDVTLLLKPVTPAGPGVLAPLFDSLIKWDVAPDFQPMGFCNITGAGAAGWANGTTIFLHLGGNSGSDGARGTFRDGTTRAVRALMPYEYWKSDYPLADWTIGNQYPWSCRFLKLRATEPPVSGLSVTDAAKHVGPMYPAKEANFERPVLILGEPLRPGTEFKVQIPVLTGLVNVGPGVFEVDVGLNFDTAGVYYSKANGAFQNDPTLVTNPLLRGSRTLYGMLTDNGRDLTGEASEVYLVLWGDTGDRDNNGAFKVIGAGTAAGSGYTNRPATAATQVRVVPVGVWDAVAGFNTLTGNQVHVEIRSQHHNSDNPASYASSTPDMAVVLTDIGGYYADHPWNRLALGHVAPFAYDLSVTSDDAGFPNPEDPLINTKIVMGMSLLYHPGRGGTARVADALYRWALKGGESATIGGYLRQCPAVLDTTFAASSGMPNNEIFWDSTHVQLWNRLPSQGWFAPKAPRTEFGGRIVGSTEQDREHELFLDRGSKTVVFRPFRDRQMTLKQLQWTVVELPNCLLGTYNYVPDATPKDGAGIFTANPDSGKKSAFAMPREFMPRFGRQDIPYYKRTSANDPFLPGINHLFVDSATLNAPVFNAIGGQDNITGGNEVTSMFFVTGLTPPQYGSWSTFLAPTNITPAYGARKTTDINPAVTFADEVLAKLRAVHSSDLGNGLRGIQLPPYQGIARLYGVYDRRDFDAKGGRTFKANRYEAETDPAPNLLREDADQQTLFILQDGAKDRTGVEGDHTYIIPENVLDLTRSAFFDPATDDFGDSDVQFVVECAVFGFAQGWIDQNNYVMVREHSGAGATNTDASDLELEGIHQCIPCPANWHHQFYTAYDRTVYQGDPFMSREGDVKTTSDYEQRYGQLAISAQYAVRTPIQQFDDAGDYIPETPNARAFEVLASMDFYTTQGTGKVGGLLYPGTLLDVGFTENNAHSALRQPVSGTAPDWRILPRAFSEGQAGNSDRAGLTLDILDHDLLTPDPTVPNTTMIQVGLLDGTILNLYARTAAAPVPVVPAADQWYVDETSSHRDFTATHAHPAPVSLLLGGSFTEDVTVNGAQIGDSVIVNPRQPFVTFTDRVVVFGWVFAPNTVRLRYIRVKPNMPFAPVPNAPAANDAVQSIAADFGAILANNWVDVAVVVQGAAIGDAIAVSRPVVGVGFPDGVVVVGWVTGANAVTLRAYNITTVGIPDPGSVNFTVAVLKDQAAETLTLNDANDVYDIRVIQTHGTEEGDALALASFLNAHASLQGTLRAHAYGRRVELEAIPTGAQGNGITVALFHTDPTVSIQNVMLLLGPWTNTQPRNSPMLRSNLLGGEDYPVNAGNGTSQMALTGMIERLPLGVLLQDSDFLAENPLHDNASAVKASPTGPRPIQTFLSLTQGGEEFDRFLGHPGELIATADGSISVTNFTAYTDTTPTGTKRFRLYRGGGSAFVLSGDHPGGPVDWVSETFPPSVLPVLKGGVLACRAMLVRNFYEQVGSGSPHKVSPGDEIQMVIATYGILGNGQTQTQGLTLGGQISPAGYGEGYAAVDRFRLMGRPMFRGFTQQVRNPATVELAVYPDAMRGV